jgi:glycosyltransferase involved in cell wall biosynthesis
VPLEAQACGTPVIALGRGGALETVRDGETGVLTGEPGPAALLAALDRLRALRLDPAAAAANAARFSRAAFRAGFERALETSRTRAGASDGKISRPVTA